MKKRFLSILLVMLMLVALLPVSAQAVSDYTLVLCEGYVYMDSVSAETEIEYEGISGSGNGRLGYTYVLENVDFTTSRDIALEIRDENATLYLIGENGFRSGRSDDTYGMYVNGNLTVSGMGSLEIVAGSTGDYGQSRGIYLNNYGTLTVESGTVTARSGEAMDSWGVNAPYSKIEMKGGTLNAIAGKAWGMSVGLAAGYVEITDGILNATGSDGAGSWGLCATEKLEILGGMVSAQAGSSEDSMDSYGMGTYGEFLLNGGTVTAWGETAAFNTAPVTDSGHTVTGRAGQTSDSAKDISGWIGDGSDDVAAWPYMLLQDRTNDDDGENVRDYTLLLQEGSAYRFWPEGGGIEAIPEDEWDGLGLSIDHDGVFGYVYTLTNTRFVTTSAIALEIDDTAATLQLQGRNTLLGGDCDAGESFGIWAKNLTVTGGGYLTVQSGVAGRSKAIYTDGDLFMEGGTVTAKALASNSMACGVWAEGSVHMAGGSLSAEGGDVISYKSWGLYTYGRLTVTGGELTGSAGQSLSWDSTGIEACQGVEIMDGCVEAYGEESVGSSLGLLTCGESLISGGEVYAMSGNAEYSCGIYADNMYNGETDESVTGNLHITGGSVTGIASQSFSSSSTGIYTSGMLEISGSSYVDAIGGNSAEWMANGIFADNGVLIHDGVVNVYVSGPGIGYGISADTVVVLGGEVYVNAGDPERGYALEAWQEGGIVILGGFVRLRASSAVTVCWDTEEESDYPYAPVTIGESGENGMRVYADSNIGGEECVMWADWSGDGSDDVSDIRYMELELGSRWIVGSVAVSGITVPVPGAAAEFGCVLPEDALYRLGYEAPFAWYVSDEQMSWIDCEHLLMEGGGSDVYFPEGNNVGEKLVFEEGKWYTAVILVELDGGRFEESMSSVTVNGETAISFAGDEYCYIFYSFRCEEAKPGVEDPDPFQPPVQILPTTPEPAAGFSVLGILVLALAVLAVLAGAGLVLGVAAVAVIVVVVVIVISIKKKKRAK